MLKTCQSVVLNKPTILHQNMFLFMGSVWFWVIKICRFTERGNVLGPVTGVPVEFDLDRTPGVWVKRLLKQLLHLEWKLKEEYGPQIDKQSYIYVATWSHTHSYTSVSDIYGFTCLSGALTENAEKAIIDATNTQMMFQQMHSGYIMYLFCNTCDSQLKVNDVQDDIPKFCLQRSCT